MPVVVITPPAPIVSLDEAKRHLRVTDDGDDDVISSCIDAAQAQIDGPYGTLGRAIGVQTLEATFGSLVEPWWARRSSWLSDAVVLPCPPVISVTSFSYRDVNGTAQTLDPSGYVLLPDGSIMPTPPSCWPSAQCRPDAIRIRYTAGYPDVGTENPVSTVPAAIRQALLLMVRDLYTMGSRDPSLTVDTVFGVGSQQFASARPPVLGQAAEALLAPFRVLSL